MLQARSQHQSTWRLPVHTWQTISLEAWLAWLRGREDKRQQTHFWNIWMCLKLGVYPQKWALKWGRRYETLWLTSGSRHTLFPDKAQKSGMYAPCQNGCELGETMSGDFSIPKQWISIFLDPNLGGFFLGETCAFQDSLHMCEVWWTRCQ